MKISYMCNNDYNIIEPGREKDFKILVFNDTLKTKEAKIIINIKSFEGHNNKVNKMVTLKPGENEEIYLSSKNLGLLGHKDISYKVNSIDGVDSGSCWVTYMKPVGINKNPHPTDLIFGIANGGSNFSKKDVIACAQIGVKVYRYDLYWGDVMPDPDTENWDELEKTMDNIEEHGGETYLLVLGTAPWAVARKVSEETKVNPPEINLWKDWNKKLARRYKNRVRFWEIWNEPDIGFFSGTIEEYIEMLKTASEQIRNEADTAIILTGGFTSFYHGKLKKGMLKRVLKECQEWFDMIAYHKHGGFKDFAQEIDYRLAPLCNKVLKNNKPVFYTETGMDTRYGIKFQAETLVKKIIFTWARDAVCFTWFNITDTNEHYGLFTKDWQPKPAYQAYNYLIKLLKDKDYQLEYQIKKGIYIFLFKNKKEQVIIYWNEYPENGSYTFWVETDSQKAEHIDIMGNNKEVYIKNGFLPLNIKKTPSYLKLKGTKNPEIKEELFNIKLAERIISGEEINIGIKFYNILPVETEYRLSFTVPDNVELEKKEYNLKISALDSKNINIKIRLKDKDFCFGNKINIKMKYSLANKLWQNTCQIPINVNALNPGNSYSEKSDFKLNKITQVVNLADSDPNSIHLMWSGPRDLSANIFTAEDNENIKFKIIVKDDIFYQAGKENLKTGDSVTIIISNPEQHGYWEFTTALVNNKTKIQIDQTPKDMTISGNKIKAKINKKDENCIYEIIISEKELGIDQKVLKEGIKFNILINDNDGEGYKGWLQLAPGVDVDRIDESAFPLLIKKQMELI